MFTILEYNIGVSLNNQHHNSTRNGKDIAKQELLQCWPKYKSVQLFGTFSKAEAVYMFDSLSPLLGRYIREALGQGVSAGCSLHTDCSLHKAVPCVQTVPCSAVWIVKIRSNLSMLIGDSNKMHNVTQSLKWLNWICIYQCGYISKWSYVEWK